MVRRINDIKTLENSTWGAKMKDPKVVAALEKDVQQWLNNKGKSSPVAKRAALALKMFRSGRAGELLTPRNVIILGASLLYAVCPLDCIPDAIPVIGWLDDLGILAMALNAIAPAFTGKKELPNETQEELREEIIEANSQNIALPEIKTDFANWGDIDDDLQALVREAHSYNNQTLNNIADDISTMAEDPLQRIIFAGSFNSGKSSLINRLLNQDLLPTETIPTTPALTHILYGEDSNVVVRYTDASYYFTRDINELKGKTCRENVDEITVQVPHHLLRNGVTIVDTAGLQDAEHTALSYEELPKALCLVFVKDITIGSLDRDERTFLSQVKSNLSENQLIVILNKADKLSEEEEKRTRNNILNELAQIGILGAKLYTTCAIEEQPHSYQLRELIADINFRANCEFSSLSCGNIAKAKEQLRELCAAEKDKQLQLQKLSEQEQIQLALITEEKREIIANRLTRRGNILKSEFRSDLHNYLHEKLLVLVNKILDESPINEEISSKIGEATRATLLQYLDTASKNIILNFKIQADELEREEIRLIGKSFSAPLPDDSYKQMSEVCKYMVPVILAATFPFMGIFGWVTHVVVPGIVLDKLGISNIIAKLGPTSMARKQIKEDFRNQLANLEKTICEQMDIFIDNCAKKRLQGEVLNLPLHD